MLEIVRQQACLWQVPSVACAPSNINRTHTVSPNTLLMTGLFGASAIICLAWSDWRRAVKCVFVLVLFEGALRKWFLPSASELIYFAKDAILAGAYLGFFCERRPSLSAQFPSLPIGLYMLCCLGVAACAFHPNIGSPLAALLGLKNYLFYVPLMVVVPHLFRNTEEAVRQLSAYALIGIPICLLGLLQFRSDAFSVVNTYSQGITEYGATTFGTSSQVRITGTFSYLTGHTVFVCFFSALSLALLAVPMAPFRYVHLCVSLPLLFANALMGGSRAALAVQSLTVFGFMISSGVAPSRQLRRAFLLVVAAVCVGALGVWFLFRDAAEASVKRWQEAGDTFYDRTAGYTVSSLSHAWEDAGIVGYGIGTASPSVAALRRVLSLGSPNEMPLMYDNEPGQVLGELGGIGFLFWFTLRVATLAAVWQSYMFVRDSRVKALVLATLLVCAPYVIMSVVLNHVAGVFMWGAIGIGIAPLLRSGGWAQHEV